MKPLLGGGYKDIIIDDTSVLAQFSKSPKVLEV